LKPKSVHQSLTMPVLRTRAKCSIPVTNPNPTVGGGNPNVSIYEKCREDRIKENLQRMKNLGIMDLSLKLKSEIRPAKRRYGNSNANPGRETSPIQLSVSSRRSSRYSLRFQSLSSLDFVHIASIFQS